MADLIISYFDNVDKGVAGGPLKSETVVTSVTSAASAAIPDTSDVCLIFSVASHYVTIGEGTPEASTANSFYLAANQPQFLRTYVARGQTVKIAAITA